MKNRAVWLALGALVLMSVRRSSKPIAGVARKRRKALPNPDASAAKLVRLEKAHG